MLRPGNLGRYRSLPNDPQSGWVDVPQAGGAADDGWQDVPEDRPKKQGFKRSLRTGMGFSPEGGLSDDISQIGSGFKQMRQHPLDSLSDLISGLASSQQDVYDKGMARAKRPGLMNSIEGGAQVLESGIPLIGPILSRMGEQTEEHDYAGAAGTGLPLLAGMDAKPGMRMAGDAMRDASGSVKPLPRLATQIATGAAGHEAMPYAGGYLGYKAGGPLSEMIVPKGNDPVFGKTSHTPWEAPVEPGTRLADQMTEDPVTRIPVPRRTFPGENPNNMGSVPRAELEGLAKTGKPGAGTQIQQLGGKVIYTPEGGYAPPKSSTTFSSKPTPTSEPETIAPVSPKAARSKSPGVQISGEGSYGPGSHKLVKDGKSVGEVHVIEKGDGKIEVSWLTGKLGVDGIKDVGNELKKMYPDAKEIVYDRIRPSDKGGGSQILPGRKIKLSDEIYNAGGEPEGERLIRTRTQPKESAASKSVKRQYKKRAETND